MTQIDWSILKPVDLGGAIQQGFETGRARARDQAKENALAAYAANPTPDALRPLAALDPATYVTLAQNERQRLVSQRQADDALRSTQARAMIPDVLTGLGLGGAPVSGGPATTSPDGEVTVTAPVKHKSVADLYTLDPELAGHIVTQIGTMQDQHRKQLGDEAEALAVAAHAAAQVPYAKRNAVIDGHRQQLMAAGFSQSDVDGFDPTDEAIGGAISHALGIKGALAQHLAEQKFAWQQQDDRIDNARADRSEGRSEYYRARTDRRAEVRFGERALDRAAMAGVSSDISDLDY